MTKAYDFWTKIYPAPATVDRRKNKRAWNRYQASVRKANKAKGRNQTVRKA